MNISRYFSYVDNLVYKDPSLRVNLKRAADAGSILPCDSNSFLSLVAGEIQEFTSFNTFSTLDRVKDHYL